MPRSIDSRLDFLSPVGVIPGLGTRRTAALNESGIFTLGDLLYQFPRRYVDRSKITPISECRNHIGSVVNVIAEITKTRVERGRRPRFRIQLTDATGTMEALWFAGIPFFRNTMCAGQRLLCTGLVSCHTGLQMIHPQTERIAENAQAPEVLYLPVYPLTLAMENAGMGQKLLRKAIDWALQNIQHFPQLLPRSIEEKRAFPSLDKCIMELHRPTDPLRLGAFNNRLVYEELYRLALTLRWSRRKFALPGRSMSPGALPEKATRLLPFTLSDDQKKAISVLHNDAAGDRRMHRLLQGDVGSGKTVVAFFACLPALNQGMQVAWLVPTEILARQAFATLSAWLLQLDIRHDLLVGLSTPGDRGRIGAGLSDGSLKFLVGTHALLQPWVKFRKLGMMVIDEQHKFGAQQRLRLAEKDAAADMLVMSATPIPQTLAKTLYGDLDIVSVQSLPAGRMPVSTHLVPENKRTDMEQFILKDIQTNNSQVFYVVPRIERDDGPDEDAGIKDVQTVFNSLKRGAFSNVEMALVHGQSDPDERQTIMKKFAAGEIKVLVATTIIEVGIDIPAATILVIENAERFGLSQLHQLRGRVGRSSKKSYCFLLANSAEDALSHKRLAYFCTHHNGFEIAEIDLTMRGPGEVAGFRQSGWEDLRSADILRDARLFNEIQNELEELFLKTAPAPSR
jgi:ATP-dependent DNA helicase RecG